jgi:hypothetical protein
VLDLYPIPHFLKLTADHKNGVTPCKAADEQISPLPGKTLI